MENSKIETWKNIKDFPDYQISTDLNVKSIKFSLERILKPRKNGCGYLSFVLTKDKKLKNISLHRIIAIAFIPNPENKPFVNHINGIKSDNRVENLEWCTAKENVQHAFNNNLSKKGKLHYKTKLTEKQVLEIRASNLKNSEIAKIYNISYTGVIDIRNRRSWKDI